MLLPVNLLLPLLAVTIDSDVCDVITAISVFWFLAFLVFSAVAGVLLLLW
jgi:hypothetical protein